MKDLGISVGIAALMWFIPPPAGVTLKAWWVCIKYLIERFSSGVAIRDPPLNILNRVSRHLLSVFVGTIVGIITTPLPLGAVAMLGMGAAMLTKVLTFPEAFSAFSSEIP